MVTYTESAFNLKGTIETEAGESWQNKNSLRFKFKASIALNFKHLNL
jgi:hypothetical protein